MSLIMQEIQDEIYCNVERHYRDNNLEKYLQSLLFKYDIKDICSAVISSNEWRDGAMKNFCDLAKEYNSKIFKNHNGNSYLVLESYEKYCLIQKIGVNSPEQFIVAYNTQSLDDGTWVWDRGGYFVTYENAKKDFTEKCNNLYIRKQERIIEKLDNELAEFKAGMFKKPPEQLYSCAYEISCVEDFYGVLAESHDFEEHELDALLNNDVKILSSLYGDWIDSDYGRREAMQDLYLDFIHDIEHKDNEIEVNVDEELEL